MHRGPGCISCTLQAMFFDNSVSRSRSPSVTLGRIGDLPGTVRADRAVVALPHADDARGFSSSTAERTPTGRRNLLAGNNFFFEAKIPENAFSASKNGGVLHHLD